MHVGILTGGGDCPGLNAVIRAVTLALVNECGARVTGIERGFEGLMKAACRPLDADAVQDILAEGGTILGSHNRCNPFDLDGADRSADALATAAALGLDALVAIGGDGTMAIAHRFEQLGLPVVGVPKTIDNDLEHTDRTFGFDSAVAVVAESLDRLRTTARSHGRVMIAETMGRHAGWIALEGGIAGGADAILIPEQPFAVDALAAFCRAREDAGLSTLVCVAEGVHPASPGAGAWLAQQLAPALGTEARHIVLGHLQRGGAPTAFDRVLSTRFGYEAAQLVKQRRFGRMVTLAGAGCDSVAIAAVAGRTRHVPVAHPLLAAAHGLGVFTGA